MFAEEISVIIFDRAGSYLHVEAINLLIKNNVTIVFCDEKHTPQALISSEFNHHRKFNMLRLQMDLLKKTKDRLWQKIIRSKIRNQLDVLKFYVEGFEKSVEVYEFEDYIKDVTEGDKLNREALAARRYFTILFGSNFRRERTKETLANSKKDDIINSSINYGYAVLRAIIRKTLVSHGLEPALGVNHASIDNPFNLSDDIIEPYRPFIDAFIVMNVIPTNENALTEEIRINLVQNILMSKCIINENVYSIHDAINLTIESLIRCYTANSSSGILLPKIIEL